MDYGMMPQPFFNMRHISIEPICESERDFVVFLGIISVSGLEASLPRGA